MRDPMNSVRPHGQHSANRVDYVVSEIGQNTEAASGPNCATMLAVLLGRRVFLSLFGALAIACASPTLPLPPPDAPAATAGATPGTVHLHAGPSSAEPNALIVILNDNAGPTNHGVVSTVRADGSWDADLSAVNNDVLTITQEFGKTVSQPLKFVVKLP